MKKCLIVVDFQNDFVTGTLGFPQAELLDGKISQKIREYRKSGDTVIFTFDTHDKDYLQTLEGSKLPVAHCIKGTVGHELYGEVACEAKGSDKRFIKRCFGSADLFEHLKSRQYERIELVGLVSNICVLANAVLAKTAQPETPVIVDAGCTASFDENLHNAALAVMSSLHIDVTEV